MILLIASFLLLLGDYWLRRRGQSGIMVIPPVLCIIGLFQLSDWPVPLRLVIGSALILYNNLGYKFDGTEKILLAAVEERAQRHRNHLE
jgi:hypothetical protein